MIERNLVRNPPSLEGGQGQEKDCLSAPTESEEELSLKALHAGNTRICARGGQCKTDSSKGGYAGPEKREPSEKGSPDFSDLGSSGIYSREVHLIGSLNLYNWTDWEFTFITGLRGRYYETLTQRQKSTITTLIGKLREN